MARLKQTARTTELINLENELKKLIYAKANNRVFQDIINKMDVPYVVNNELSLGRNILILLKF